MKNKKTLKCPICKGTMKKIKDEIRQDKVEFEAYKCAKCGKELVEMAQLEKLAGKYRKLRKAKEAVFSKWGNSIAIRIPADYVEALHIQPGKHALMIQTEKGLNILPA